MVFNIIDNKLTLTKSINELDSFVLDIVQVLSKYTDYVIVSGYVAIFFGRSRATEDVDMFIKEISSDSFRLLYDEFVRAGYDFTVSDAVDLYDSYLSDGLAINLWRKDFPLMRMEIKFARKPFQRQILRERIQVTFDGHVLYFSPIEAQVAYKRTILRSDKDIEDALHLERVFHLSVEKIKYYKDLLLFYEKSDQN